MVTMVPGVFVDELPSAARAVVAVGTSVPVFLGYTEVAELNGTSLRNTPTRVTSMVEFERCFGGAPIQKHVRFSFAETTPTNPGALAISGSHYLLVQTHGFYALHSAMQLYFQNGGGACFVVSVGGYEGSETPGVQLSAAAFSAGLQALDAEPQTAQTATIALIPEVVLLSRRECYALQNQLLTRCGQARQSRFAILDIHEGHRARSATDCIQEFREAVGVGVDGNGNGSSHSRSFGAAYYPWLNTSIVPSSALGFNNVAANDLPTLVAVIQRELMTLNVTKLRRSRLSLATSRIVTTPTNKTKQQTALVKRWALVSPAVNAVMSEMTRQLNLLPPSAAMAGVFAANDAARGVWKAPANIVLNAVLSPAVTVTNQDQEDLNIDAMHGKSVNALRAFPGKGVLVWGARTLDGNNNDWRYINVRRLFMMVEESARLALAAFVFERNEASTWVQAKAMLENFLTTLWRQGALAGAKPEHAYVVAVGLGTTMTANDVSSGLMHIDLLLAASRPAEFIAIRLTQQLLPSA